MKKCKNIYPLPRKNLLFFELTKKLKGVFKYLALQIRPPKKWHLCSTFALLREVTLTPSSQPQVVRRRKRNKMRFLFHAFLGKRFMCLLFGSASERQSPPPPPPPTSSTCQAHFKSSHFPRKSYSGNKEENFLGFLL